MKFNQACKLIGLFSQSKIEWESSKKTKISVSESYIVRKIEERTEAKKQGDFILAEPGALICFAGPRVIKQTIGEDLPDGFQKSEFLLQKGFLDAIVHRKEMKKTLLRLIKFSSKTI